MHIVLLDEAVRQHVTLASHLPDGWLSNNEVDKKYINILDYNNFTTSVIDSQFSRHYSLKIKTSISRSAFDKFPYELNKLRKEATFTRLQKSTQQAYLKKALRGSENFYPIPTWSKPFTATIDSNKLYVLKAEHGARGIGQFYFNPGSISLSKISKILTKVSKTADEIRSKPKTADDIDKVQYNSGEPLKTNLLKEAIKDIDDVKYISDRDNHPDEGFDILFNDLHDDSGAICEYIEHIAAEFRVLTGCDGVPVYCIGRTLERRVAIGSVQISQGCGNNETPNDNMIQPGGPTPVLLSYTPITSRDEKGIVCGEQLVDNRVSMDPILTTIASLQLPMHSFDVFVTYHGKWGIFEFCPQFGVDAVPQDLLVKQSMEYIEKTLKQLAQS